jgi:hypothetical protein
VQDSAVLVGVFWLGRLCVGSFVQWHPSGYVGLANLGSESERCIGSRVRLVGVSISFEKNFYRLPFTPPPPLWFVVSVLQYVPFDSGASFSFVSEGFVGHTGIYVQQIGQAVTVSSAKGLVSSTFDSPGCRISLADEYFVANLVIIHWIYLMLFFGWTSFLAIRLLSLAFGRQSHCRHLQDVRLYSRVVMLSFPLHCYATCFLVTG